MTTAPCKATPGSTRISIHLPGRSESGGDSPCVTACHRLGSCLSPVTHSWNQPAERREGDAPRSTPERGGDARLVVLPANSCCHSPGSAPVPLRSLLQRHSKRCNTETATRQPTGSSSADAPPILLLFLGSGVSCRCKLGGFQAAAGDLLSNSP